MFIEVVESMPVEEKPFYSLENCCINNNKKLSVSLRHYFTQLYLYIVTRYRSSYKREARERKVF